MMPVDVPEDLALSDEDIQSALEIVTGADAVLHRLLSESGGSVTSPKPALMRMREVRIEKWEAAEGVPVVPPGEKLLFRCSPDMPIWPRELRVFARPATVRVCEVQLRDGHFHAHEAVVDLRRVPQERPPNRRLGLPLIMVAQELYAIVENTGTEPSIVRPVVVGDMVDLLGPGMLGMSYDAIAEDDVEIADAMHNVRRSVPMGMQHGRRRCSFAVGPESYASIVWRSLWRCSPKEFRVREASPSLDGLSVASIQYSTRMVMEKEEEITGDWQPFPQSDMGLDPGLQLSIRLRNRSQEPKHVVIELRVGEQAA